MRWARHAAGLFAAFGFVAPAACTSVSDTSHEDRILTYRCDELVVIGRLKNQAYEAIDDPDDILGHGVISADLIVKRVVTGGQLPATIAVRYAAHAYMREDRDFLFVLSRGTGAYGISSAQLMSRRPQAVTGECDEPPDGAADGKH